MRYIQVVDGEWVQPRRRHYVRCCDCGLVHRIDVRVRAGRVEFRAFRLRRRGKRTA